MSPIARDPKGGEGTPNHLLAPAPEVQGAQHGQFGGYGNGPPPPPGSSSGSSATRWVLIVLGAILLAGGFYFTRKHAATTAANDGPKPGASGSAAAEGRPVPVLITKVEKRDVPIYLEGLGNVAAFNTVTVRSQIDGKLDKIVFTEGQEVKKGDVLALIDPRPFTAALHQAQAAVARDLATSKNAQVTLDRTTALNQQGLAAQADVDNARAALMSAQAAVRGDEAAAETARLNLDYARITSPIDGITGVRMIDVGNVIHQTDPGLVVITQIHPIAVLFTLPQDDLPRILDEMHKGDVEVDAYSRDGATKLGSGKIMLVDNEINQQTATIRLKAIMQNPDHALWPSQFVKAQVLLTTKKSALVVPSSVVQRGPKGTFVYAVGPDNKAVMTPVTIEATQGELAIIGQGLQEGEQVVADGQYQLRPGSTIVAREPVKQTSPERPAGIAPPVGMPRGANSVTGGLPPPATVKHDVKKSAQ